MIREHLFHERAAADPWSRWRGGEVSRVDGVHAAVGFAGGKKVERRRDALGAVA